MPIIATVITAGAILTVLVVLLALAAIAIRAEDHRTRGILSPPPSYLASAARHLTGLHVRHPAPNPVHPEPTAPTAALRIEGRWDW